MSAVRGPTQRVGPDDSRRQMNNREKAGPGRQISLSGRGRQRMPTRGRQSMPDKARQPPCRGRPAPLRGTARNPKGDEGGRQGGGCKAHQGPTNGRHQTARQNDRQGPKLLTEREAEAGNQGGRQPMPAPRGRQPLSAPRGRQGNSPRGQSQQHSRGGRQEEGAQATGISTRYPRQGNGS